MATVIHSTFLPSISQSYLVISLPPKPLHRHQALPSIHCLSLTKPKPIGIPFSTSSMKFLLKSHTTPPKLQQQKQQQQQQQQQQQLHPHYSSPEVLGNSLLSDDTFSLSASWRHLLRFSIDNSDFDLAKAIHASIAKVEEDTHLANSLIVAYLRLGNVNDAHKIFACLSSPDVASYAALISAYAKSNREGKAIELFFMMRDSGIEPNEYSFVAILTACIRLSDLQLGSQIHSLAIKTGYYYCIYVSNALMGMYLESNSSDHSNQLFGEMAQRDVASWNTVMSGAVKKLQYERVFELFHNMQQIDGLSVDKFTLSILLDASKGSFAWMKGREIHAYALKCGFGSNVSVNNALIGFYTKCGSIEDVVAIFERMPIKDVISWTEMLNAYMEFGLVETAVQIFDQIWDPNSISYNALLAGYCRNGEGSRALELFQEMLEEGMELSNFTLTSVVNACALLSEVAASKQIHGFMLKAGFGSNHLIEAALLDMCTKCGRMDDAQKIFSQWSNRQHYSIVWTSMIRGYARNGKLNETLSLFSMMQVGDIILDEVASTAVLGVCGMLGFHELGKQLQSYVLKSGFISDLGVSNAIVSMYAKCANMEDASKSFSLMPKHDTISWNCLIGGHLLHRQGNKSLAAWSKMQEMGIKPDSITLVLIISAYRHTSTNLVDACHSLLFSMRSLYGIEPTSAHYASMVGVFGYWRYLKEAEELISNMPFEPDGSVWRALLDSSRLRSNTILGKWAAKHLLAMDLQDPSMYILVANLYSASGRWHCSERIREEMREKGLRKHPGQSWIIHQNRVHSFFMREKSHFHTKDIYSGLDILILECMKAGYVPDTSFVLHEVEENQKKDFLFYHSAKLAVTFGLLMTGHGKPVRVMKNIHLCGDCHTFLKYVSIVTKREVSLRDASGFHNFRDGECSCGDYW
ncbi:pentatricopeptide repeat-containing protein At5g03800 [Macadamia integrifolia]|uniref:pentatricopeptide repeat-containing protein At5g03800 n=1 Tax=Macadamia integrifolia TaxID=60698 RepID=UPI001C4F2A91|nr:pentatricopeptide repeat-containing protein At5g03800 [Macadamia integrifolia]